MTPVREALEEIIGLLDKMAALHPSRDLREVLPDPKGLADRARLLLSAAPGEPCAVKPLEWHKHPDDNEWYSIDEGHYQISDYVVHHSPNSDGWCLRVRGNLLDEDYPTHESAKAAAQADYEQRIRSALVTTPQPAAGWDWLPIEHRPLKTGTYLVGHRGHQEIMKFFGPDVHWIPGTQMGWLRLTENGWRRDDPVERFKATHCIMIQAPGDRREAPAPAERVTTKKTYIKPLRTIVEIDARYADQIRDLLNARPDSAEARLREALDVAHDKFCKIADTEVWTDSCLDGWRRSPGALREYAEMAASEIDKALSPPSGGDEAKESEGGQLHDPEPLTVAVQKAVAAFNALSPEQQEAHLRAQRESYVRAEMELSRLERGETRVSPSEPSPPADRREIVPRPTEAAMRRLTEAQRKVLSACADGGRTKDQFLSLYWRNFDQLERRGLLSSLHAFNAITWHPTPAGRAALAQSEEKK